ncbi:MAG TPA: hypothetical protein VK427_02770, partial [Kofleriaceae bacterium]|nr:hypothetical protein [Kofleriaceae bacterium]
MARKLLCCAVTVVSSAAAVWLVGRIPHAPIGFLLFPVIALAYRGRLVMGLLSTVIVTTMSLMLLVPDEPL